MFNNFSMSVEDIIVANDLLKASDYCNLILNDSHNSIACHYILYEGGEDFAPSQKRSPINLCRAAFILEILKVY